MLPVLADAKDIPAGYRRAGGQLIRVDLAEKIVRAAFDARAKASSEKERSPRFRLDLALPVVHAALREDLGQRGGDRHRGSITWRPRAPVSATPSERTRIIFRFCRRFFSSAVSSRSFS